LHTAAHEAAHIVQQRQGVHLKGGVGEVGDAYEQHADAVADRVVAGQSAADLLGGASTDTAPAGGAVQRKAEPKISDASLDERRDQFARANTAGTQAVIAGVRLATHELQTIAGHIKSVVLTPDDEIGMSRQIGTIQHHFDTGSEIVQRACTELRVSHDARIPAGDELGRVMFSFERGFSDFYNAALRAHIEVNKDEHHLALDVGLNAMARQVKVIFDDQHLNLADLAASKPPAGASGHAITDARLEPIDHLLAEALDTGATATFETARSVRMSMNSSMEDLEPRVRRLIEHVRELASMVERANKKTVTKHRSLIARAVKEAQTLENDAAGKPQLAKRIGAGVFDEALRKLHEKISR
jgi:hypothetical protein